MRTPYQLKSIASEALSKGLRLLASIAAALLLANCSNLSQETIRGALNADGEPLIERSRVTGPTTVASDFTPTAGALDDRVALVIGNSDYGPGIGRLTNPINDATDMAEALKRTGFTVKLLLNASREDMQRAVLEFDQDMRKSDVGLFYYAGHAVQVNGRNFMIPMEAKLDISGSRPEAVADYVALETLEIDNVLGRMGNAETDLSIVILDACRNNPFNQGARGISRGLAQTSAPRGTFVAYATSPGKIAHDGNGENSPYTSAIVKNLETPGLKLEDVFKKVRQDVALQTDGDQIPWENSSVFGDFYFNPSQPSAEPEPSVVAATPPAAAPLPAAQPAPSLSRDDYAEVQELLTRIGFYDGPTTGELDEKTRNAIVQWQALHGLELNGEVTKSEIPFLRTDAVRAETKGDKRFERRLKKTKGLAKAKKRGEADAQKRVRPEPKQEQKKAPTRNWNQIVVPPPPA